MCQVVQEADPGHMVYAFFAHIPNTLGPNRLSRACTSFDYRSKYPRSYSVKLISHISSATWRTPTSSPANTVLKWIFCPPLDRSTQTGQWSRFYRERGNSHPGARRICRLMGYTDRLGGSSLTLDGAPLEVVLMDKVFKLILLL